VSDPVWICTNCGLVHSFTRPAKLWCRCGGAIEPDYGFWDLVAEEEQRFRELMANVGPCPDLQAMGLGWDKPIIH